MELKCFSSRKNVMTQPHVTNPNAVPAVPMREYQAYMSLRSVLAVR
jgi:hypothetical protein